MDQGQITALIKAAIDVKDNAYCPYSKFPVGAALLSTSGRCNVENASYGGTICAERAAICRAISEGERHFTAVACVSDLDKHLPPCGLCRQLLGEFGGDLLVFECKADGTYRMPVRTLDELMPDRFAPEVLASFQPRQ